MQLLAASAIPNPNLSLGNKTFSDHLGDEPNENLALLRCIWWLRLVSQPKIEIEHSISAMSSP